MRSDRMSRSPSSRNKEGNRRTEGRRGRSGGQRSPRRKRDSRSRSRGGERRRDKGRGERKQYSRRDRDSRSRGRRRSPSSSSSSRSDESDSLISSSSDSDPDTVRRWLRKRRSRGHSRVVKLEGESMEELILNASDMRIEGRYGNWHDYLQYLHVYVNDYSTAVGLHSLKYIILLCRHGQGARPPPGNDPHKMTYKIKFNFLMSLSRKQRRGNVNRVLKNELEKRKKQRRLSRAAAKKTPLHPMDPMYRQQMQIMATYGSTKSASTATTIGQAPPSTSNPNLNNAEVVTSTVAAAKSAPSISQTSSVVNPVPASIIVMPNANESKKSKEGAENASEEVFQSKNEETNSIPPSTEKSVTTKQAAPPPYLQD
eukprot:jgi/Bigna1/90724/estExt_fgenesh1_pg.C_770105